MGPKSTFRLDAFLADEWAKAHQSLLATTTSAYWNDVSDNCESTEGEEEPDVFVLGADVAPVPPLPVVLSLFAVVLLVTDILPL